MNGPELRKFRRDAEVEVADLARHLGMFRQRIHEIEKWAVVSEDIRTTYVGGVEALRKAPATA